MTTNDLLVELCVLGVESRLLLLNQGGIGLLIQELFSFLLYLYLFNNSLKFIKFGRIPALILMPRFLHWPDLRNVETGPVG